MKKIPLDNIRPNREQPRKHFDEQELNNLAASIEMNGLIQPITVRPIKGEDGYYEIIFGERRWRAHKLLALKGKLKDNVISANVRSMDDEKRDLQAILENLQRVDVSPIEEARAFKRMIDLHGYTPAALAKALGIKKRYRLTESLALLDLEDGIQTMVASGAISRYAAYYISLLAPHQQTDIVRRIGQGHLTSDISIRAACEAIKTKESQPAMFNLPEVSEEDRKTVNAMEAAIERMIALVNRGWKDGDCRIAVQVDPSKSRLMSEKLRLIRHTISHMERELEAAHGQRAIFAQAAEQVAEAA